MAFLRPKRFWLGLHFPWAFGVTCKKACITYCGISCLSIDYTELTRRGSGVLALYRCNDESGKG